MGEIVQKRDLAVVTAEIITIRDRTQQMILDGSIEIGKRLCEAKEIVGHGGWGDYLRDKVEFSAVQTRSGRRALHRCGSLLSDP